MGKGEIARYGHFFLLPQCFQKACFPGASKGVIVWEWVKTLSLQISESGYLPSSPRTDVMDVCLLTPRIKISDEDYQYL